MKSMQSVSPVKKKLIERRLFYLTSPVIPARDYRRAGLVFMKALIQKAFPDLYQRWYELEEGEKKPFTFHVRFRGKKTGDFFILERPIVIQVSGEESFLDAIQKAFRSIGKTEISLKVGDAYVTLTPLMVKNIKFPVSKRLRFYDLLIPYKDRYFISKFGNLPLFEQFVRYFGSNGFRIKNLFSFRTKLAYHRFKGELYRFTAIETEMELESEDSKLIELYRYGVGWYRSAGFGFPIPILE